jgi:xylan 1,4-beta-xylosidase
MGSPQPPTPEQRAQLERAGELAVLNEPQMIRIQRHQATLRFMLPRQAVSLVKLSW